MGFVRAVAGSVSVANTIPGRIPPTVEPIPGKLSAGPKVPLFGERLTPSVGFTGAAQPMVNPVAPPTVARPSREAAPPTYGNCTNGWLNAGRKTAVPAMLHPGGIPFGARMIAGPLPLNGNFNCEFGR